MREINHMPVQLMFKSEFDIDKVSFNLAVRSTNKPTRALWTSSLLDNGGSAWQDWCDAEDFPYCSGEHNKYILYPKKDIRLIEFDMPEDFEDIPLCEGDWDYGWYVRKYINFIELSKLGYDGFHVTDDGACRGKLFPWMGDVMVEIANLGCYDCESTVCFNTDWIDKYERVV